MKKVGEGQLRLDLGGGGQTECCICWKVMKKLLSDALLDGWVLIGQELWCPKCRKRLAAGRRVNYREDDRSCEG